MRGKKEIIGEWIEKADHDLGTAKIIYLQIPTYHDIISFNCQQAVEKYIKAILLLNDIEFIKSHNLIYLLNLLPFKISDEDKKYKNAAFLNNFSVEFRYPNETIKLTNEDIEIAIYIAEDFRKFAQEIIGFE